MIRAKDEKIMETWCLGVDKEDRNEKALDIVQPTWAGLSMGGVEEQRYR